MGTIISVREARNLFEKNAARFIDCRSALGDNEAGRNMFHKGHIPGAIFAHLDNDLSGTIISGETGRHPLPEREKFTHLIQSWGILPEDEIIVYDLWHGGVASRLWWMLHHWGHDNVHVLDGGWKAWERMNMPIETDARSYEASNWSASLGQLPFMDIDELTENARNDRVYMVDARAHERFLGEKEPIDPIAGHIPGANSFPFLENMNKDGFWKSREELKTRFENVFTHNQEVVVYCGSGVTACHNILAMYHADLPWATLYPGSWSEWITQNYGS